jgi:trk system potassium uptake protein TrkH
MGKPPKIHPFKKILSFFGTILILGGIITFIPLIFCIKNIYKINNPIYDQASAKYFLWFFIPGCLSVIVGYMLSRKYVEEPLSLGDAMVAATIAWLVIPLVGAFPFVKYFGLQSSITLHTILDSYFEAVSGYTATGLTMVEVPETAPRCILFWRSLTEWFGGMGIIVLFLVILVRRPGTAMARLYLAEGRADRIKPSVIETVKVMWKIYLTFTIIGIFLLFSMGVPFFDAVNHSMTAIATGGFATKRASIGAYNNLGVEAVIIFLMLTGAISFVVHKKLFDRKFSEAFKNLEFQALFLISFIGIIIIVGKFCAQKKFLTEDVIGVDHSSITKAIKVDLRIATFQCISAITGTGFSTVNLTEWKDRDFEKIILTGLMIIGGSYGSTSSAIKLLRFIVMVYSVIWIVKRSFLPQRAVLPFKIKTHYFKETEIMTASLYLFLYLVILIIGSLILMLVANCSAVDAFFEVASAEGNVGLSVGITGQDLHYIGKIVLIIEMVAGRLEIFPLLAFANFCLKLWRGVHLYF